MLNSKFVLVSSVAIASVGGICLFKDYNGGELFNKELRADGKTAIVTGASSGIGKETAFDLARRGAKVYMACQDLAKCETIRKDIVINTRNRYVYCRPCNLASFDSIRNFVKIFKEEQDRLDILINNAGVMHHPDRVTSDGIEMHLGVNYMGHFLLTNLLLDYLKNSQPSRIVNVTSVAHAKGKINKDDLNLEKSYDPTEAYNQSKLALVLFTNELAIRLSETKVTVCAVNPGLSDTDLTRHLPVKKSFSYYWLYPLSWPFLKSGRMGAQTSIYAALEPSIEKISGEYYSNNKKDTMAPSGNDFETAKWLWAVSEKWTRLKQYNAQ